MPKYKNPPRERETPYSRPHRAASPARPPQRSVLSRETLSVCAWNMQRRPMLDHGKDDQKARRKALATLCGTHDVVMVSEPGVDLLRAVASGASSQSDATASLPAGLWIRNETTDNQSDSHACRSLLYVGRAHAARVTPHDLGFRSGGVDACRYPASGLLSLAGDHAVMLTSFHATSGFNGSNSTYELMEHVADTAAARRARYQGVFVGGDLNCKVAKFGGTNTPSAPTHHSGHILDGFYGEGVGDDDEVSVQLVAKPAITTGFRLVTKQPHLQPGQYGCMTGNDATVLSDHVPVSTVIEIVVYDDDG